MCGILGLINTNGLELEDIINAKKSLLSIKHRGPDGAGLFLVNSKNGNNIEIHIKDRPEDLKEFSEIPKDLKMFDTILGHRRLSIFDLSSKGHQPMKFNNCIITFNGEIYNFPELRNELSSLGYSFFTNTDTEVLISAYRQWGNECVNHFNGMWSFIIFDSLKKSFFISNDRFGVKPLYSFVSENLKIFTSEIKQFRSFKNLNLSKNNTLINQYLLGVQIGYDHNTLFNEIIKVTPGSTINIKEYKINYNKFYDVFSIKKDNISFDDAIVKFKSLFHDSVKLRTRADVKWGIGLSGGLDSSSILQESLEFTKEFKISTFSAVFPNQNGDESSAINLMLKNKIINNYSVNPFNKITLEDYKNFLFYQEIPPISTSFYAQYKVSELVKKSNIKINLVGQGADEVFGGYHSHFFRYCRSLILNGQLINYFKEIIGYSQIKNISKISIHKIVLGDFKTRFQFKLGLNNIENNLSKYWLEIDNLTKFMKYDFTMFQLPYYLTSDDRTSMAHSVETRHPFLDYRIVEFGFSLPENFYINKGWSKFIIRNSILDLPKEISWRKDKKGFTTPMNKMLNKINIKNHNKFCVNHILNL